MHSGSSANYAATEEPGVRRSALAHPALPLATFTSGTPFAWLSGEVVTTGLRNANGFTKNAAGRMYAVVNGLDDVSYGGMNVHNDNPGEQVVEIAMGKSYGYPYCFTAQRVMRRGRRSSRRARSSRTAPCTTRRGARRTRCQPSTFIQAHSAPLDITFFDDQPKGALPEKLPRRSVRRAARLVGSEPGHRLQGHLDPVRRDRQGADADLDHDRHDVPVRGRSSAAATPPAAKDGAWSWTTTDYSDQPRFAGVAISPVDGALYAASDSGGYIYRVGIAPP